MQGSKWKSSLFAAALMAFSTSALAMGAIPFAGSLGDFIAPVVPDATAITNAQTGLLVYDSGDAAFKGYNSSGSWDTLTPSPTVLTIVLSMCG